MSERRRPWRRPTNSWQTLPQQPKGRRANVFTIPASAPFSATLARGVLQRFGRHLADVTIYLPTRRVARGIAEVFAREAGGATLLPDFRPLGDIDEDELLLTTAEEELDLPPAIAPLRRRLLLATLIRRWKHARDGGTMTFGQAAGLARSLAAVMDEVEQQGASLAGLEDIAPAALASHWAEVKDFLKLIDSEWPKLLRVEGRVNPETHRNAALRALARHLLESPPPGPVIAAGSTGSIPATAELLDSIARLPQGAIVLPGLDCELDAESWERLDPGHPQFTLKQLLDRISVPRAAVQDWAGADPRPECELLLREVLRPAPTTDAWRALAEREDPVLEKGVQHLTLLPAANPAEEAAAIALLLREFVEQPTGTAALVTRDRALARRVTAELSRWNIAIDDSAGRPLSLTPAGSFLCLIAEAADSGFAPVPLLALLKHPLASMGDAALLRRHARALDGHLRGPRPDGGLAGIANALRQAPRDLQSWFTKVIAILAPLEAALMDPEVAIGATLAAHVAAAEQLADVEKLWRGTDGEAANLLVSDLADAATRDLPAIESGSYAPLFRTLADEIAVRPAFGRHPRLAILGPLEARLQTFDLTILGGLNEGSWPASPADDPWFSRPMRTALGLEQPERAIGLSAHDFATLAAGPRVVLTRSLKSEGTPTVASRWIQRLVQLTRGLGLEDRLAPPGAWQQWRETLSHPGEQTPEKPPAPCPPVSERPRRMPVTDIEKWIRDPYAIYAKHVLALKPLDPLDQEIGPLERGSAMHKALERFAQKYPRELPAEAARDLIQIADEVFEELGTPKSVLSLWRPRFARAAEWFVREDRKRRAAITEIFAEIKGETPFQGPAGPFVLHGRADRIDRLRAGGAVILDYKTGAPPSDKQVKAHLSPQLPLEGAMLAVGGFKEIGACGPAEFVYVRIGGAGEPGNFRAIKADAGTLAQEAAARLTERIALFDDPTMGYASRVAPFRADMAGDYDHLARVREWSVSGWREEE
ncbi:MAG: double-strand break repair protein AddB [Alphaproteobacteria bacterium]|nr:double-strand break repair protein AddB [Alphaproteobacteria bacterium]